MREKTVCFTGHRIIPSEKRASLFAHLTDVITSLLEAGYRYFGAGGALGFDTLAAQAVLQLRTEYPQIRLILFQQRNLFFLQAHKPILLIGGEANILLRILGQTFHILLNGPHFTIPLDIASST